MKKRRAHSTSGRAVKRPRGKQHQQLEGGGGGGGGGDDDSSEEEEDENIGSERGNPNPPVINEANEAMIKTQIKHAVEVCFMFLK